MQIKFTSKEGLNYQLKAIFDFWQLAKNQHKGELKMSLSDHEYVNFSQEHELNYHLRKVEKSQSIENRKTLVVMGNELKSKLNATYLTHAQFHAYVKTQLTRLG